MARPQNKSDLLAFSQKNFDALMSLIESLSSEEQHKEFPEGTMNRNIRDVLMHLHHWHCLMMEWYQVGMDGKKPAMPTQGYTWKMTPALNRFIWEKYRETALKDAIKATRVSHQKINDLISQHTNEELFEKKRFPWTGTTTLGSYFVSSSSSHYDWAIKLIRKAKNKTLFLSK